MWMNDHVFSLGYLASFVDLQNASQEIEQMIQPIVVSPLSGLANTR